MNTAQSATVDSTSEDGAKQREFHFSSRDFSRIRDFIGEQTGIVLAEGKRDMVYSRLARRLRELKLERFSQYLDRLDRDEQELGRFINALTTNLTAFFREPHHFDFVRRELLPSLAADPRRTRLRAWSAGCSSGEEPYSLAITLLESLPQDRNWDLRILATDLDSDVVEKGRQGIYTEERVAGLPGSRLRRWFRRGTGSRAGLVRVSPHLQELILFKQLNLLHDWPFRGPLDVIFCRNTVIYFDKSTQKVLFERFADLLVDGGHIFIGHSESMFKVTDRFESLGNTIYRKRC